MLYKIEWTLACGCSWTMRDVKKQDIPDIGDVYTCPQHDNQSVINVKYRGQ